MDRRLALAARARRSRDRIAMLERELEAERAQRATRVPVAAIPP